MKLFFMFIIFIFSNLLFSLEFNNKILFPFESTILLPNYTYEIKWENSGLPWTNVKIELFQDGSSFLIISQNTENDGKFLWTIPDKLHTGIPNPYNYSIIISDLLNSNNFIESDLFVISPSDYISPFIIVPASAHSIGSNNSFWKTDLYLYNNYQYEDFIDIYLFFFKEGRKEDEPPIGYYFKMQNGEIKIIKDIVKSAFRTEGAGMIIVEEHYIHEIYWVIPANAFLYNDMGEKGTYGTFIPAMSDAADRYFLTNKFLLSLKENEDFRTNIGISNIANFPIDVKIFVYNDKAELIGEKEITLPLFGFHQEYRIYKQFTSEPVNGGFAYVKVLNNEYIGFIYPFASVIDSRVGDVYFIPQF